MTKTRFDAYQAITDAVVQRLESGVAPWRQPWTSAGLPVSLGSGKAYRGINVFLLHTQALSAGYRRPEWGTYKAITEKGGQVRKGERGTLIVFFSPVVDKEKVDAKGKPRRYFILRSYKVFNAEQADGLDLPELPTAAQHSPVEAAELVAKGYLGRDGAPSMTLGGSEAYYLPKADAIHVPVLADHRGPAEYYSTLFHEIGHSTGHESRLNRPGIAAHTHFGDARYSREELVAELTAAMLAGHAGISPGVIDNQAAYLASWVRVLRGDSKLVVQAAAAAQRASDLVLGVSWGEGDDQ